MTCFNQLLKGPQFCRWYFQMTFLGTEIIVFWFNNLTGIHFLDVQLSTWGSIDPLIACCWMGEKLSTGPILPLCNGPLDRYVKLRVAHAPGTFSPPPRVTDPDMHRTTCVTHVPWCMPGSLIRGFLWSRWREKRSRHSRRIVSDKRPMARMHVIYMCVFVCLNRSQSPVH